MEHLFHNGDLIVRAGNDQLSELFKKLNTIEKKYSHCGVLIKKDNNYYVAHIIAGLKHRHHRILLEKWEDFVQEKNNNAWAVYRYALDTQFIKKMTDTLLVWKSSRNIAFDADFDLISNDKMYCSELVYKALLAAGAKVDFIQQSSTRQAKKYIAIDNLYKHKYCNLICEMRYK